MLPNNIDLSIFNRTEEEFDSLVKMWLWSSIIHIEDGRTGWDKDDFKKALVGWLTEGGSK